MTATHRRDLLDACPEIADDPPDLLALVVRAVVRSWPAGMNAGHWYAVEIEQVGKPDWFLVTWRVVAYTT